MAKSKTPEIDGVPVDQIIKMGDLEDGGCYTRAERISTRENRVKFTAFVKWVYGASDDPDTEYTYIEEIDVMATDESDARTIAELALIWHYEEGGTIVDVKEVPESTFHHWF